MKLNPEYKKVNKIPTHPNPVINSMNKVNGKCLIANYGFVIVYTANPQEVVDPEQVAMLENELGLKRKKGKK